MAQALWTVLCLEAASCGQRGEQPGKPGKDGSNAPVPGMGWLSQQVTSVFSLASHWPKLTVGHLSHFCLAAAGMRLV
jgi:hypothetical protein